jgi:DNA-binding NarL/FixJ family response regulator
MKIFLSHCENEVLTLSLAGLQRKEIASKTNKSTKTVKFHVGNVLRKTGASDMSALRDMFGNLQVKLVWVPKIDAPEIIVNNPPQRKREQK